MKVLMFVNDYVEVSINKCEAGLYLEMKRSDDDSDLLNIILDEEEVEELKEYLNEWKKI